MSDEKIDIKVGDMVEWWTRYADDIIRKHSYQSPLGNSTVEYKNFDVYRFKFNDIMSINQRDIQILKE
mgnify:CR=1 FL=1